MSRIMLRALWILPLVLAGCASDEQYIVVTVDARPAVHDVATLRVTLSNAGSMRTEDLPIGKVLLPATFSISPADRAGELGISIEAFDEDGGMVGVGATQSTIEATTASVLLDPTDFVVNTEYADDQQISNYYGAAGLQVAATASGTWTTAYNAACPTSCNVFGRRFDAAARPVTSAVAAGTLGFPLSTKLTTKYYGTPGIAANATTTIALWNHDDPVATSTYSIECRALDASGAATSGQLLIASDEFPDIVSATPLASGNFAVVWDGRVTNTLIRTAIVKPDCTLVGAVGAASPSLTGSFPHRSHVTANTTNILYTWILDGSVRGRVARLDGGGTAADVQLVAKTATEQIEFVRTVPLGAGFGIIVRWSTIGGGTAAPGRLELYRVSNTATVIGSPTLVSSRSGSDFESREAFGVAPRDDGSFLVVWHACLDKGDGNGCGVFGRLFRATGEPAGDELGLATTVINDQTRPSAAALPGGAFAVAWTDRSLAAPDTSGAAVRARIIYPAAPGAAN